MSASIWNPSGFLGTLFASAINFIQAGVGAITRTVEDKLRERVSLEDFGGIGNDLSVDNSIAITNWLNYIYANNCVGVAGPGTFAHSASLTLTYAAGSKIAIRGSSKGATTFRRTGANSGHCLKVTIASASYLETKLEISDLYLEAPGLSNVDGFVFDSAAYVTMQRCGTQNVREAVVGAGLLVSTIQDCEFSGNSGIKFRRGVAGSQPYANLNNVKNVRIKSCPGWALDIGEGSGLSFEDLDIENNGTASSTTSGGIVIRSTVDDETGSSTITFKNIHLESNLGHSFLCENATNLYLALKNVQVLNHETTKAITIGTIRAVTYEQVVALGASSTLTSSAELQFFLGANAVTNVNTTGAALRVGSVKTGVSNGDFWEFTRGITDFLTVNTELASPKLVLTDGIAAPGNITGRAQLYVDSADGDLKIRFSDGVIKTIVTDT